MSEARQYRLHLGSENPGGDWHKDPATPKQIARLRYLGVAPRGHFTKGQAGALIDQTEIDPRFQEAVERWHQDKYRLHPKLYPPTTRDKDDAREWQECFGKDNIYGMEFRRPTQLQTVQVLERLDHAFPGWDQGHESLKRDQQFMNALAEMFPALCKRACSYPRALAQPPNAVPPPLPSLAVGPSSVHASPATVPPVPWLPYKLTPKPLPASRNRLPWVLGFVALFIGAMIIAAGFSSKTSPPPVAKAAEVTPPPTPTQTVPARPAKPSPPRELAKRVAQAQRDAVTRYPALGMANTEMNSRFVFQYKKLAASHSPRLQDPNWPLQLADECAAASGMRVQTMSDSTLKPH